MIHRKRTQNVRSNYQSILLVGIFLVISTVLLGYSTASTKVDFSHEPSRAPLPVPAGINQESTSAVKPANQEATPQQSPIIKQLHNARQAGDIEAMRNIEAMLTQPRVLGEDRGEYTTTPSNAVGSLGEPEGASAGSEATFGTDINVRNFTTIERNQSMASDSNGNLYVAIETDHSSTGFYYIQIYTSSDGGNTWSAYGYVLSSNVHLTQPSIAIGEGTNNRLLVAYIVDDGTNIPHPEVAVGPLGQNSFTIIPIDYISTWHSYSKPVLWTDSYDWSNWWSYLTSEASFDGTTNTNVAFWRTTDSGATFSTHYTAWGNADTDNWQDPDGTYGTTLDRIFLASFNNTDKNLYAQSSDNYGATWNAQVQVGVDTTAWEDPSNPVDPDIEAATSHDNVMVAFTRGSGGNDNIGQTYSTDAGNTFPRSRWNLDGSDSNANEFAAELTANEGGGSWHLAYTRNDWWIRHAARPQDLSAFWPSTHEVVNDTDFASNAYPKKGIASNWTTDVVGIAWSDFRSGVSGDYDTWFDYDRDAASPPDINVVPNTIDLTEAVSSSAAPAKAPAAPPEASKQASQTAATNITQVGELVIEPVNATYSSIDTGNVWERTFSSPNASYIAIHFADFNLPDGAFMEISSPDGQFSYTYRGKGKVVRGGAETLSTFWASHIPGDTAKVRIFSKDPQSGAPFTVNIDKWAHGYPKDVVNTLLDTLLKASKGPENMGNEAICSIDDKEWAACYAGTTMYNKANSVARLLINGTGACTGWLLGSEGHLMTNEHCISTQSDADNTDYEFMAEGATCSTDCSGWFACPGTVAASSGTLVKDDVSLDYALILLPTNLTGTYGYLQLRNVLPGVGERIYIPQHPGGKGKQLGVVDDTAGGAFCSVASTNATPCAGGPGDVGYMCDTEGGSSGSPVLASSDDLVVGLHHCANCPNRAVPIPDIIANLGSDLPNDAVGNVADNCFNIYNEGGSVLDVTGMSKRDGDAWLTWSPNAPFSIAPAGSQRVCASVDWNLVPSGGDDEQIIINSNDPDENPYLNGVFVNVTPVAGPPGQATLVSPSGAIGTSNPTYTWNAVSNSTWYYLWVNDTTGTPIKTWYSAADAGCAAGTGTCSITPAIAVTGASTWFIQTWNTNGSGPWSSGLGFTAPSGGVPAAATLVSPSGTIGTNNPTYTWNAVSNSTSYYLWVNDTTGTPIKIWYTAADAGCASGTGTCAITPAIAVTGASTWWIQTWNTNGSGPWSSGLAFTAPSGGVPPAATLVSPSGTIGTNNPTYTWNAVSSSTWYYLWVNDSTGTPIKTWYRAADAGCASGTGTCAITPATAVTGASTWWIQTWNMSGDGPWSSGLGFTAP